MPVLLFKAALLYAYTAHGLNHKPVYASIRFKEVKKVL
jgi:hypothetical protein